MLHSRIWAPVLVASLCCSGNAMAFNFNFNFDFSGMGGFGGISWSKHQARQDKVVCQLRDDGKANCMPESEVVDLMVDSRMPFSRAHIQNILAQARTLNGVQSDEGLLVGGNGAFASVSLGRKLSRGTAGAGTFGGALYAVNATTLPAGNTTRKQSEKECEAEACIETGVNELWGPPWGGVGDFMCTGYGDPGSCRDCCGVFSTMLVGSVAKFAMECHGASTINFWGHVACGIAEAAALGVIWWQHGECKDNCGIMYEETYDATLQWEDSTAEDNLLADYGARIDGTVEVNSDAEVILYSQDYGPLLLTGDKVEELSYIASEQGVEVSIYTHRLDSAGTPFNTYIIRSIGEHVFDTTDPNHTQVVVGTLQKDRSGDYILTGRHNRDHTVALDVLAGSADILESKLGSTVAAVGGMNEVNITRTSRFGVIRFNVVDTNTYRPATRGTMIFNPSMQRYMPSSTDTASYRIGEWINDHDK